MTGLNVKNELAKAVEQFRRLLNQKELLEVEIAKQRRKVAAWQELCAAEDDSAPDSGLVACSDAFIETLLDLGGLTDACRTVLRGSRKEWMTTSEIQAALRELGFNMEKYKAPHASITTTVNRLAEGENAEVVVNRRSNPGATEYKWVGSRFSAEARKRYGAADSLASQDADGRPKDARDNFVTPTEKKRPRI